MPSVFSPIIIFMMAALYFPKSSSGVISTLISDVSLTGSRSLSINFDKSSIWGESLSISDDRSIEADRNL